MYLKYLFFKKNAIIKNFYSKKIVICYRQNFILLHQNAPNCIISNKNFGLGWGHVPEPPYIVLISIKQSYLQVYNGNKYTLVKE